MNDRLTPEEAAQLRDVIDGLDTALTWLDADLARLQRSLDAGISLEVIGALNQIIYRELP